MIKSIDPSDYSIRPFKVHKTWTFSSGAEGFVVDEGLKLTGSFDTASAETNSSGRYKKTVYDQIRQNYYVHTQSVTDPFGGVSTGSETSRSLHSRVNVLSIPERYFGEEIKPGSVTIVDRSQGVEKTFLDDGNRNLYTEETYLDLPGEDGNYVTAGINQHVRNSTATYLDRGDIALHLPGTVSNYASVPDEDALDISGDIDLRAEARLSDWDRTNDGGLVGKYQSGERSYLLYIGGSGDLRFLVSEDGTAINAASRVHGINNGERSWVRATWRQSDGRVQLFKSSDGESWTQLGVDGTLNIPSIYTGSAGVEVGSYFEGISNSVVNGSIYKAQIFDGIDGNKVFDVDFTTAFSGSTSTEAITGQTVTINQNGSRQANLDYTYLFKEASGSRGGLRDAHYIKANDGSWYRGTLLEGQSTNVLSPSSNMSTSSAWGADTGDLVITPVASIIEGETAWLHEYDGGANSDRVRVISGSLSSNPETLSWIVEHRDGVDTPTTKFGLRDWDAGGWVVIDTFNFTSETFTSLGGGVGTAKSSNAILLTENGPNGGNVWLLSITGTPTNPGNERRCWLYPPQQGQSGSLIIHHVQHEEAPFASSPIITGGSSVTRRGDQFKDKIDFGVQDLTLYMKFIESGIITTGEKVVSIGNATGTGHILVTIDANPNPGGGYRGNINDASNVWHGGAVTGSSSIGDVIEIALQMNVSDSSFKAFLSINGSGVFSTGESSGVDYNGPFATPEIRLGHSVFSQDGYSSIISGPIISSGIKTLQEMRDLTENDSLYWYENGDTYRDYRISGDLDLRYRRDGNWDPVEDVYYISHLSDGYALSLTDSGSLKLEWYDGSSLNELTSSVTMSDESSRQWVRGTLDVDDGAGDAIARFYTSIDGTSWSQLGSDVSFGSTTEVYDQNHTDLVLGGKNTTTGSNTHEGKVYQAQVYDGIDGTKILDVNFADDTKYNSNKTAITSSEGYIFTLQTSGSGDVAEIFSGSVNVGNVFYQHGIVTVTNPDNFYTQSLLGSGANNWEIDFDSTTTIYEHEILCPLLPKEANISTNPTAVTGSDQHLVESDFFGYEYSSSIDPTGSYLTPYVTTVGLYDDDLNLVAVAKVAKPLKKTPDQGLNILVRFDV